MPRTTALGQGRVGGRPRLKDEERQEAKCCKSGKMRGEEALEYTLQGATASPGSCSLSVALQGRDGDQERPQQDRREGV